MRSKQLLPVLSAILLASGALAEDNLTKLGQFKTTGVTEFTTIAQDGPAANSIRNILRTIELPPGFTIDLYALVPDARHMAMAPQGTALFVGTKKEKVWVVMDRDGDNIGDEVAAKDLIGVPGIEIAIDLTEITYWHFICDQHQVVFAEGAASESLYTGPEALKMLGAEARAEIYQIFPELRDAPTLCSKTGPSNLDASRK